MEDKEKSLEEQCVELEEAIAAQEAQRRALGDSVVDLTIKALQAQLDILRNHQLENIQKSLNKKFTEKLHSHIPKNLAAKMRAIGSIKEEKRQVTVLFADMVGFTSFCESLDQELVSTLTNEILKELSKAVYQYEGYVDRFLGDAVMAVFGAPLTHEDDAERALHAALEMRKRIDDLDRKWSTRLGRPLETHIGINTGEVIAGYSDFRMSYYVIGDTVNVAARLEAAAKPGQILVSGNTYRLTREAFSFLAMEPVRLKGKSAPLAIYGLLRAKMIPRKTRGLTDMASAFVGREFELNQLESIAEGLNAGNGRIVALNGDGGIGKSRLMAEWRNKIERTGDINWVEGRCLPFTTSIAYGPFLDLLRRYADINEEQTEEAARRRLDIAVARFFPDNQEAGLVFANLTGMELSPKDQKVLEAIPAVELRNRILNLIETIFTILAKNRPTIMIIEDMHWADTASLELLEHLFDLTKRLPFVIVCVHRPDDKTTQWIEKTRTVHGEYLTVIPLSPLSADSSYEMMSQLLSLADLPTYLSDLIITKAEGNPFYVEELIRTLIEHGALARTASGQWQANESIENINIPDTLHGLLMARLDKLSPETKLLAQQAAVIGRIFLYRVLQQLAPQRVGKLDDELGSMEREDLIRKRTRYQELEYMFRHALTQEVAYESLLTRSRIEIHRKVGEAMEQLFKDRISEFAGIIGEHFIKGEAWEKAVKYLTRSGDAAARIYANVEARKYYDLALEALEQVSDNLTNRRKKVDLSIKFAKAAYFGMPPQELLQRLEEAKQTAESLPRPDGTPGPDKLRLARLNFQIGLIHYSANRMKEAVGYYKEVLEVAPELGDPELLGIPSFAIGNALVFQGHIGKARKLLSQGMEALEQTENWFYLGRAKAMRSCTMTMMGDCLDAQKEARTALDYGKKINSANLITAANLMLITSYIYADTTGDSMRLTLEAGQRAAEAAENAEDMLLMYIAPGIMAWNLAMAGRFEEASYSMDKCKAMAKKMGEQLFMFDHFISREAEIALGLGQLEKAKKLAEQAIEVSQKGGGVWAEGHARRILALALTALDSSLFDKAEKQMQKSVELFELGQNYMGIAHTHIAWGKAYRGQGNLDAAHGHWQKAADFFESKGLEKRFIQVQELMRT